ncbi:DUF881 domain-containing protein [Alkaliphilus pronyensis]|uniref:DUF881 domain-containing protein n=1 Tax=Alkaliphilus pronyensis TaxID=1482732 RepID=A0A6I0FE10_9FIRM|nr:DUF881 domain-containing protein [Alkaliphilus pronyensis]KAB3538582.1 DUF881 domain-containing protein [Alkaliphilus pronyensis]
MMDKKGKLVVIILCILSGIALSMQFKVMVSHTDEGGDFTSIRAYQVRQLKSENERLNNELSELQKRLREYEIFKEDENFIIKNLEKDLEKYKILAGDHSVEGPGVTITIEDQHISEGIVSRYIMYNYDILLELIHKLNAAGAEAISINDQRYVSTTEIFLNSNQIHINSQPMSPPFTIKAIGNPETLEAALNMRFDLVWRLRQEDRINIKVNKEDHIAILKYDKPQHFKYAKPIEESQ